MNMDTQMCTPHNLTLLASYLDLCPGRGTANSPRILEQTLQGWVSCSSWTLLVSSEGSQQ